MSWDNLPETKAADQAGPTPASPFFSPVFALPNPTAEHFRIRRRFELDAVEAN
jgi:hypothetical protein